MKKWISVLLSVMLCLITFTASASFGFQGLISIVDENISFINASSDENGHTNAIMLEDPNLNAMTIASCHWDIVEKRLSPDENWSDYYELIKADLNVIYVPDALPLTFSDVHGDGKIRWMMVTTKAGKSSLVMMEGSGYVLYEAYYVSVPETYGDELVSKAIVNRDFHPFARLIGQTLLFDKTNEYSIRYNKGSSYFSIDHDEIGIIADGVFLDKNDLDIDWDKADIKISNGVEWVLTTGNYAYIKDGTQYASFDIFYDFFDLESFMNDCVFLNPAV